MRDRFKPKLFDGDDPTAAARQRISIVAPTQPAPATRCKRASKVALSARRSTASKDCWATLATRTRNGMTIPSSR